MPGVGRGAALRLPRARPLGPRGGRALQPGQAPARSLRPRHRGRGALGPGGPRRRAGRSRPREPHRLGAVRAALASSGRDAFDWGDDRPPAHRARRLDHLRAPRQGLHPAAPRGARGRCAAPTPAWRTRRRSSTCVDLGVTAVELLPVHQFVHDEVLVGARPAQLLGLPVDRLLRPAQRVLVRRATTGRRSSSSSGWCRPCTRRASR